MSLQKHISEGSYQIPAKSISLLKFKRIFCIGKSMFEPIVCKSQTLKVVSHAT